ncbi:DUF2336 domain-containing protein [uncultured Cohaesibacter sp.]|uniref:DUF2336 domain-containing protein n=1 Tax=uncultured Cohaesibacter sp. TaxID=1002546 RepID=UPI0029C8223B|nr:DUF2336 domain-containing protein [uncultured Cohaesibacter sp.]
MKSPGARSRLVEETESYFTAGQFDRLARAEFTKVFRRLFGSTALADRVRLAERLCNERAVPREVVQLLCCDVDAVAAPLLAHSPLLGACDLTAQIMQGSSGKRTTIAQRSDLSAIVISQLLLFGEPPVARALAENKEIHSLISRPMQMKIERIGGTAFEHMGPTAMSQDKDKLDALVSSMEQDWCAHYKPEALDTQDTRTQSSVPFAAADAEGPSLTMPDAAAAEATLAANDIAPETLSAPAEPVASDTMLLLDEADMKILDQLSESDWESLDDDAIEALARQLAAEDSALIAEMETGAEYGAPSEEAIEQAPAAESVETADSQLVAAPIAETQLEDAVSLAAKNSVIDEPSVERADAPDDLAMMDSPSEPYDRDAFEEETGPASFTIGVFDSENAAFPPLRTPLGPNEREAIVAFHQPEALEEDLEELLVARATRKREPEATPLDTRADIADEPFGQGTKKSFTISADTASDFELAPAQMNRLVSGAVSVDKRVDVPPYRLSPIDDLKSALKRPLDHAEEQLLAKTREKLETGITGKDKLPTEPEGVGERKAQITLTIRKSSDNTASTVDVLKATPITEPASEPAPVVSEEKSTSATVTKPSVRTTTSVSIPGVHLTSATEDDWERALARLTGDVSPQDEDDDEPRVFSVPANTSVAKTELTPAAAGAASPVATVEDSALHPVVEAIESELSIDAFSEESTSTTKQEDSLAPREPLAPRSQLIPDEPAFVESLPIPRGAIKPKADTSASDSDAPVIHEHAPLGFMPDMISFAGLDLVEAEPDLPSATELLLKQSGFAAPRVELIEPIDIDVLENGKLTRLEDLDTTPMQVISEQLEAQRSALNELRLKMKRYEDATANSRFQAYLEKTEDHSESTPSTLEVPAPEAYANAEDDLLSLPEFSGHRLVEVEEFQVIRQTTAEEEETETEVAPSPVSLGSSNPIDLAAMAIAPIGSTGIADRFFAYDEETRLTLIQSILAETLVEMARQDADDNARALLDEDTIHALVTARFSNDRIRLADLMHDISGHRRLDMIQLLQDKGGEALVVYLYAIGVDESSSLSILLHGPDAISHDYDKISRLMTLFHQLYPAAANKIVTQLFGEPRRIAAKHQPIHDEGSGKASARLRGANQEHQGQNGGAQESPSTATGFGRRTTRPDQG